MPQNWDFMCRGWKKLNPYPSEVGRFNGFNVYVIIYMAYNHMYLDIHERLLTRPSEVTDQMNQYSGLTQFIQKALGLNGWVQPAFAFWWLWAPHVGSSITPPGSRIILCVNEANERWCYDVTFLIGWGHAQNDPCGDCIFLSIYSELSSRCNIHYTKDFTEIGS